MICGEMAGLGLLLRPCGELAGVGSVGSALEATEAEREGVGDFSGLGDSEAAFSRGAGVWLRGGEGCWLEVVRGVRLVEVG